MRREDLRNAQSQVTLPDDAKRVLVDLIRVFATASPHVRRELARRIKLVIDARQKPAQSPRRRSRENFKDAEVLQGLVQDLFANSKHNPQIVSLRVEGQKKPYGIVGEFRFPRRTDTYRFRCGEVGSSLLVSVGLGEHSLAENVFLPLDERGRAIFESLLKCASEERWHFHREAYIAHVKAGGHPTEGSFHFDRPEEER